MPGLTRDLDLLQPEFAGRVKQWLTRLKSQGIELFISETLRSYERSTALYAQGRTSPGKIITKARAGQSYHNFGLALDCYPVLHGKTVINFDRDAEAFAVIKQAAAEASAFQIEWGGNWKNFKDLPHFQDSLAPSLAECREKWPKGWING